MNYLVLTITLVFSFSAFGSICTDQIFENEEFIGKDDSKNPLPEESIQCMLKDADFINALGLLCTEDQTDITPVYKTYFEYHQALMAAEDAWRNNTDKNLTDVLLFDVRRAFDREQLFLQVNDEIATAQLDMYRAKSNCTKN